MICAPRGAAATLPRLTSRWFAALLSGCLPLAPTDIRGVNTFVPHQLQVTHADDVLDKLAWLQGIAGGRDHVELIAACLGVVRRSG